MDNLLIQVRGRKRVVLYSPREATKLYLNGDKSEVLDIDNPDLSRFPKFTEVIPYECFLEPGDVLFIPAMWFHNVISLEVSGSCNISNMRCSVSSPDETLRRELKIRHTAEYFWWTLRCFIWWWNTVSNCWHYFSNKIILEEEITDAKMSSFSKTH